jgi:hypothetical protein
MKDDQLSFIEAIDAAIDRAQEQTGLSVFVCIPVGAASRKRIKVRISVDHPERPEGYTKRIYTGEPDVLAIIESIAITCGEHLRKLDRH